MNIRISTLFFISGALIFLNVAKANIPVGFESFFEWDNRYVKLRSLDGSNWGTVKLAVQYNKIRFVDDVNNIEIEKFEDFLSQNKVKKSVIDSVLLEMKSGMESNARCAGKIKNCSYIPEVISFYYDYDDNLLYMYANISILEPEMVEKKYESSYNKDNALINHIDVYASSYQGRNDSLTVSDKAVLGLGYGFTKVDYELTSREGMRNDGRLYEFSYNLDYKGIGISLGRFNRATPTNSTDFIQPKNNINEYSVNFFSSGKMLSNKDDSKQRLNFFTPADGEINIYQGDRVFYRKSIKAGQGYISYDNLPYGRNEIRVEIVNFGKVVSSESVAIVNFKSDNLANGETDFFISAGSLEQKFNSQNEFLWESLSFGKSLFSYRANDFFTLALGGMYTHEASYGSFGVKAFLPYNIHTDILSELYSDGGFFFSSGISMPQFNIRYESFQVGDSRLSSYMHDFNNYYQITANGYLHLPWGDTGYLTVSKGRRSVRSIGDLPYLTNKVNYWNAALGYRTNIGEHSQLEVNLDYQGDTDDVSIALQFTVPIGEKAQVRSSASWRNGLDQIRNSLTVQDSSLDNGSYNMTVAHNYYDGKGPDGMLDAYFGYNYSNDYMQTGINSYLDSTGNRGVNINFSSTQIINDRELRLSKNSAESYIMLDIDSSDDMDSYGLISISDKKRLHSKFFVDRKKQVIPLPSYRKYDVDFNAEAVSLFTASNERVTDFTLPGKAISIQRKVAKTVSFLAQFVDILEQPVKGIQCVGLACNSTQELSSGVYQISVLNGDLFQLKQQGLVCYISEAKLTSGKYNFGKNYCIPDVSIGESTVVKSDFGDSKEFIFLGVYNNHYLLNKHMEKVIEFGGNVVSANIESSTLLFVEKNEDFTRNSKSLELINNMSALQKELGNNVYSITLR
ncbi:TcfC E-set like domain-containing protein [Shewanella algae]|uniref:TcfC E-set like domain-containing protein n=1 Tax=Shewanella algae TaxID=38313 RepID=UPI0031F53EC4